MLAVFVGGPAAWVYYGPLPDGAQKIVGRLVAGAKQFIGWAPGEDSFPVTKTAPRFERRPAVAQSSNLSVEVEPLLIQLRSMGVVEYVLENWGTGGLFRFHCAMPFTHSDDLTEHFEAIAGDELTAIRQVVEDVTSWQVARR